MVGHQQNSNIYFLLAVSSFKMSVTILVTKFASEIHLICITNRRKRLIRQFTYLYCSNRHIHNQVYRCVFHHMNHQFDHTLDIQPLQNSEQFAPN